MSKRKDKRPAVHQPTALPDAPKLRRRTVVLLLLAITLAASALRLADFGNAPPGLNQDEAAEAWNSWCLLKTGKDQVGQSWPVFYTRALGSNFPTLYMYLVMPFQAVGGMSITTTRLPSAVAGILAVVLAFYVGRRLFGPGVGLMAAALLALNPWAIHLSRWAAQSNICPFLAIVPLAMLLWARMPPVWSPEQKPRIILAALAGLVTGICCYGYTSIRLFLPVFMIAVVIVSWRQWLACLKTRRGLIAISAFAIGVAVTFGPLFYKHLTDPEIIKRGQKIWIWAQNGSDMPVPSSQKISAVAGRYIDHFSPEFLFIRGDYSQLQSPPNMGMFYWYMLPLMLAGLCFSIRGARRNMGCRIVLAWTILYPIGDILSKHDIEGSMHAFRSSPGLAGLILLGACGAIGTGLWLWQERRSLFWPAVGALILVAAVLNVRYLKTFFGEYNGWPIIYHKYHVDLVKACQWLRPQMDKIDAVFVTSMPPEDPRFAATGGNVPFNQPYIVSLVVLGYDPQQWFAEPPDWRKAEYDIYYHYGKVNFMHWDFFGDGSGNVQRRPSAFWAMAMEKLAANGKTDRVIFLVRPWEVSVNPCLPKLGPPVERIKRPDGKQVLWICESQM